MGIPTLEFLRATDTGVSYKRMLFDFTDFDLFFSLASRLPLFQAGQIDPETKTVFTDAFLFVYRCDAFLLFASLPLSYSFLAQVNIFSLWLDRV